MRLPFEPESGISFPNCSCVCPGAVLSLSHTPSPLLLHHVLSRSSKVILLHFSYFITITEFPATSLAVKSRAARTHAVAVSGETGISPVRIVRGAKQVLGEILTE